MNTEEISSVMGKNSVLIGQDIEVEIQNLCDEFPSCLKRADDLCELVDPENAPFKSKYEARDLLELLSKRLEATKTIAFVEGKGKLANQELNWRMGSIHVRLATINLDCEEPHNCEIELNLASKIYFNDLYDTILQLTNVDDLDETKEDELQRLRHELENNENAATEIENSVPPTPDIVALFSGMNLNAIIVDALKWLNLSGILWAGRGRVRRSFMFLYSSLNLYNRYFSNSKDSPFIDRTGIVLKDEVSREVENAYTHTLFYLAQAYAHLGQTHKSSYYCHETLQRQYAEGFSNTKAALEWVKNCLGMADYHFKIGQPLPSLYSVLSCEYVFQNDILKVENIDKNELASSNTPISELYGEILKRMINLDLKAIRQAFYRETSRTNEPTVWTKDQRSDEMDEPSDGIKAVPHAVGTTLEYFKKLPIVISEKLSGEEIVDFESARVVYLRAAGRLEIAKKIFPLDGFVTEHVALLMQHSKLYHYLATFESNLKRRFTMESRRADLLQPLLTIINPSAFEALHKQLTYELGEVYITLTDIKMDLIREKHGPDVAVDAVKAVDREKVNEFCRLGLAMFTTFTAFYAKRSPDRQATNNNSSGSSSHAIYDVLKETIEDIESRACYDPDHGLLTGEELRPFLNCHFLSARLLSKILVSTKAPNQEQAKYLVLCLKRYQWLATQAPKLAEAKHADISNEFGVEHAVCQDMVALLPSKIDRIHYSGSAGLTLLP